MHITIEDTVAKSDLSKHSKSQNKKPSVSKSTKERKTANKFLSSEALQKWNNNFKIDESLVPEVQSRHEFLSFLSNRQKQIVLDKKLDNKRKLSLCEWLPWQNTLQPTFNVSHSNRTHVYVEMQKFIELQDMLENKNAYADEIDLFLDPNDLPSISDPTLTHESGTNSCTKELAPKRVYQPLVTFDSEEENSAENDSPEIIYDSSRKQSVEAETLFVKSVTGANCLRTETESKRHSPNSFTDDFPMKDGDTVSDISESKPSHNKSSALDPSRFESEEYFNQMFPIYSPPCQDLTDSSSSSSLSSDVAKRTSTTSKSSLDFLDLVDEWGDVVKGKSASPDHLATCQTTSTTLGTKNNDEYKENECISSKCKNLSITKQKKSDPSSVDLAVKRLTKRSAHKKCYKEQDVQVLSSVANVSSDFIATSDEKISPRKQSDFYSNNLSKMMVDENSNDLSDENPESVQPVHSQHNQHNTTISEKHAKNVVLSPSLLFDDTFDLNDSVFNRTVNLRSPPRDNVSSTVSVSNVTKTSLIFENNLCKSSVKVSVESDQNLKQDSGLYTFTQAMSSLQTQAPITTPCKLFDSPKSHENSLSDNCEANEISISQLSQAEIPQFDLGFDFDDLDNDEFIPPSPPHTQSSKTINGSNLNRLSSLSQLSSFNPGKPETKPTANIDIGVLNVVSNSKADNHSINKLKPQTQQMQQSPCNKSKSWRPFLNYEDKDSVPTAVILPQSQSKSVDYDKSILKNFSDDEDFPEFLNQTDNKISPAANDDTPLCPRKTKRSRVLDDTPYSNVKLVKRHSSAAVKGSSTKAESFNVKNRSPKSLFGHDSDDEDFVDEVFPLPPKLSDVPDPARKQLKPKTTAKRSRNEFEFIEFEAALSPDENHHDSDDNDDDDECNDAVDSYDESFIDDEANSPACEGKNARALFLEDAQKVEDESSHPFQLKPDHADMDIFSQVPSHDPGYQEDSFCVGNDVTINERDDFSEVTMLNDSLFQAANHRVTRRMHRNKTSSREKVMEGSATLVLTKRMGVKDHKAVCRPGRKRIITATDSSDEENFTEPEPPDTSERVPPIFNPNTVLPTSIANQKNKPHSLQLFKENQVTHNQASLISKSPISSSKILLNPSFSGESSFKSNHLSDDSLRDLKWHSGVSSGRSISNISCPVSISNQVNTSSSPTREHRLHISKLKREEFRRKHASLLKSSTSALTAAVSTTTDAFQHSFTPGCDLDRGVRELNESRIITEDSFHNFKLSDVNSVTIETTGNQNSRLSVKHDKSTVPVPHSSSYYNNVTPILEDSDKSRLHVLVDTRELSASQELISSLRHKHQMRISVLSIGTCDFIVSNRMGIERKCLSDFQNSSNREKLLERLTTLCDQFDRPILVLENDRVKPVAGARSPSLSTPPFKTVLKSRYVEQVLACLTQLHIKVLYSSNQEESASIIVKLAEQENIKQFSIKCQVDLDPLSEQRFKFYQSLPSVSLITALNMVQNFTSIHHFLSCSEKDLCQQLSINSFKASQIFSYVRHTFIPEMIPKR